MICTRGADSAPPQPFRIISNGSNITWPVVNFLAILIIKQHYKTILLVLREHGGDYTHLNKKKLGEMVEGGLIQPPPQYE